MTNYKRKTWDDAAKCLSSALKNKTGFSLISFGDAEMIFLSVPEIDQVKNLDIYLSISGVRKENIQLKKEMIDLIPENDFIWVHNLAKKETDTRLTRNEWAKFSYIWDDLLKYYNIENVKVIEKIGRRYTIVIDGSLFNLISGARVLLIGFHAPMAEERFKHPEFVEHYKKMNFDKINIVGSISCPESTGTGDVVDDILEQTKKFDYDVALLGVGISSCYLCPKIKQMGKIALDVGHIIQAMAGKGHKERPYINNFNY